MTWRSSIREKVAGNDSPAPVNFFVPMRGPMTTEVQAMTDDEARALGERWIKAGGGWRRGMTAMESKIEPPMVTLPDWDEAVVIWTPDDSRVPACTVLGKVRPLHDGAVPDLRDPATRGAALDVVRERWGLPKVSTIWDPYFGRSYRPEDESDHSDNDPSVIAADNKRQWRVGVLGEGATEAEALVVALEAAP